MLDLKNKVLYMIAAIGSFCLLLSACAPEQAEKSVMDEIRSAPVVKLECSGLAGGGPVFADNVGTTAAIADMRIHAADSGSDEEWIYRFTYNPAEKVLDGREIVLLFGFSALSIDGVTYQPEDGVAYDAVLEWAEGVYDYYAG